MKRIAWIDAFKGYAICMMMFSHIEFVPRPLKNFISPLFLAAFFLSAGYTFHAGSSFKDFFLKKCKTLLWPWLVFASFNIFLTQILTFSEHAPLKTQFLHLFLQIRGEDDGLWFFPCMFMVINLFFLLDTYLKPRRIFWAVFPFLLAAGMAYTLRGGVDLPWHVQMWGAGCFYMAVGYFYRIHEKMLTFITRKSTLLISFLLFVIAGIGNEYFYPDNHISFYDYGVSVPFYCIIMLISCLLWFSFLTQIPAPKIIQYAGRNSLMYFAFHGKPKRLITVLLTKLSLVPDIHWTLNLTLALLDLVLLTFLLVVPCEIVNRYFPFLLGKKGNVHR